MLASFINTVYNLYYKGLSSVEMLALESFAEKFGVFVKNSM